jgi:hypothetical protein
MNNTNNTDGTPCDFCKLLTSSYARKVHGKWSMIWCLSLTILTGGMIFCFGSNHFENCKDTEVQCAVCRRRKALLNQKVVLD